MYNKQIKELEETLLHIAGVPCACDGKRFTALILPEHTGTTAPNASAGYNIARLVVRRKDFTPVEGASVCNLKIGNARIIVHNGALVHAYGGSNNLYSFYVRVF